MSTSSMLSERKKISFNYVLIPKTKDATDYITYLNDYYQTDDVVAYLKINEDITTPVVQAEDNIYYLTFYKYLWNDNIMNSSRDSFVINTRDNSVNMVYIEDRKYDVYYNKKVAYLIKSCFYSLLIH